MGTRSSSGATISRMAEKAKKTAKALVVLRKDWVAEAGVGDFVEPEHPHPKQQLANFYAVPVVHFTLDDGWFLEMEFYPPTLKGKSLKLFVPKQEVLAVMQTHNPDDLPGFKP
jgi:hypothetical protein